MVVTESPIMRVMTVLVEVAAFVQERRAVPVEPPYTTVKLVGFSGGVVMADTTV
jgi:hypothetical protein